MGKRKGSPKLAGAGKGVFHKMAGDAFPTPKRRGGNGGGGGKPGNGKPSGNGKPGDGKPGDGKPGDGKPDKDTTQKESRDTGDKTTTQDPIDLATGEVLFAQTDVRLAGVLPLVVERTHLSSHRRGRLFGTSWASTLDQYLELEATGIAYVASDGMVVRFPLVNIPRVVTLPVEGAQHRHLAMTGDGGYTLTDGRSGRTLHFRAPGEQTGWSRLPLAAITDRNGNRIDLVYDEGGALTQVRHSGDYRIAVDTVPFQSPVGGAGEWRVSALRLLVQDAGGSADGVILMRYGYDAKGDLAEVVNESGRPLRFFYDDEHRLTSWRDRAGHGYDYTYDDRGRAVAGAGTSGHLNTRIRFGEPDAAGIRRTVQTDSLGHSTTYEFNDAYQLIAQTDPLGNTSRLSATATTGFCRTPIRSATPHDSVMTKSATSRPSAGPRNAVPPPSTTS
ncbi:DUF6531 domain-containing protein [Actinomadura sp. 1N219]|uniref:DUF6531 domain-containing protein n=1 Tax=Actinomadura sp. 1N219 TaxID=3375152 RepID=UPI0037B55E14